jgi:hypothetical protein
VESRDEPSLRRGLRFSDEVVINSFHGAFSVSRKSRFGFNDSNLIFLLVWQNGEVRQLTSEHLNAPIID